MTNALINPYKYGKKKNDGYIILFRYFIEFQKTLLFDIVISRLAV